MTDQNNTLQNLATMALLSTKNAGQPQPIETANIGGHNLLVNRPTGFNERLGAGIAPLQALATNFLLMQKMKRQQDFTSQINTIMGSDMPLEDATEGGKPSEGKLSKMYKLVLQYPDMAKEMGVLEPITNQYQKMKEKGTQGWKPQTKEEAMEVRAAGTKTKGGKIMPGTYVDKISQKETANITLSRATDALVAEKDRFAKFMGPGKGAFRNPLLSYANKDLQDFLAWQANVQDAFQQYRVAITGAQASDAEIRLLEKNRPTQNDTYEVFLKKSKAVQEIGESVLNRYIKNLGRAGYDVSGYEDMVNTTGKKVETEMPHSIEESQSEIPKVGQMFNGQRIKAIRRKK